MKRDDLRSWLAATQLSMPARFVFIALTLHANRNGEAWPAVGRLVTETGCSERTVRRALRELEAFGDVVSKTRDGATTVYRITAADPGHPDPPATVAPRSHSTRTPAKSASNPGHCGPQKELKELVRSAPPPPDTSIGAKDVERGMAGVNGARTAKGAALRGARHGGAR